MLKTRAGEIVGETIALWPDAGQALGSESNGAYGRSAARRDSDLRFGKRIRVPIAAFERGEFELDPAIENGSQRRLFVFTRRTPHDPVPRPSERP